MKTIIASGYTFVPANGTLDLSQVPQVAGLGNLYAVVNVTARRIIYVFGKPGLGGSWLNRVVTLDADVSLMHPSDVLAIVYDTGDRPPAGTALDTTLQAIEAVLKGTLNVAVTSSVLPSGAATEATLAAVKAALLAQVDFEETIWTDGTSFFSRRVSEAEGTGTYTVTWTDTAGNVVSAPSGVEPAARTPYNAIETAYFDATVAGPGVSAGDVLARVLVLNTRTNTVSATLWHNLTTGAAVATPAVGSYVEQTKSVVATSPQLPGALVGGRLAVDGSGVTQPVSGSVQATILARFSGTLPAYAADGFASPQIDSNGRLYVTLGPNAAKETGGNLDAIKAAVTGVLLVSGQAAAGTAPANPPLSVSGVDGQGLKRHLLTDATGRLNVTWSGQTVAAAQSGAWSVTLGAGSAAIGSVSVSNFPATQAVSGTVTANQGAAGSAAWPVADGADGAGTNPGSGARGWLSGVYARLGGTLTTALAAGTATIGAVTQAGTWAVNSTLQAGSAIVGKVGIDQTTPGATNGVTPVPATSGGLLSAIYNTFQAQGGSLLAKGSPGQSYVAEVWNTDTVGVWFKLFDKASAPTLGTDSAKVNIYVPPGAGRTVDLSAHGCQHPTGIGAAITGGPGLTDNTAVTAGKAGFTLFYK